METTIEETRRDRDALDVPSRAGVIAAARKELGELEGLKASSIVVKSASAEHHCSQCSTIFGEGREVLWIRTRDDEKVKIIVGVTLELTWKARPWHRSCWDYFEASVDARRVELEKILGDDHHELDA